MAKIFEWLKPTSTPPTNGFDVSKRQTFSLAPGMLVPAISRVFSPKSNARLTLGNSVINSLPFINQPFNRGQFVIDFFQVPMKQIMDRFDAFYTQLDEEFSSAVDSDVVPSIPHFDCWTLCSFIAHDIAYLLPLTKDSNNVYHYSWNPNLYGTSSQNTKLILGVDVHGIPRAFGTLRLLDMLGYGNWYLVIKEAILNYSTSSPDDDLDIQSGLVAWYVAKYIFTSCIDGEDTTQEYYDAVDDFFEHGWNASMSVYNNLLEINFSNLSGFGGLGSPKLCFNALKLYAYQKVFSDIYRNSFYDKPNRYAFNCDDVCNDYSGDGLLEVFSAWDSMFGNDNPDWYLHVSLFELRYRQFKKDLFTSLLPNSQFGEVSMVNVGDSVFNLNILNAQKDASGRSSLTSFQNEKVRSTAYGSAPATSDPVAKFTSDNLTFSVLMQRRAEALQKYKERFLRAGNRLRDQYLSEFGKVPYYLEDKYCRFLGSIDSRLNVNGIPATADTGDYQVGERASYSVNSPNGNIEFSCDDWSIVLGIIYYLPELDYEAFGVDADNKFSEFSDYIVPEFENLGLEPVYRTTLSNLSTKVAGSDVPVGGERVIGYGPSYMYFKTDVDRLHGEFGHTNDLDGVFSTWVTSRGNVSMSELSDYYVKPDFLNSIMRQQFKGLQNSDQFLCCLDMDFKVVQPLSVVGLPIWN